MPLSRRGPGVALSADGRAYVMGGATPTGQGSTSVQVYDPEAATWATGSSLPLNVARAKAVALGTDIYLFGSGRESGAWAFCRKLNTLTGTWTAFAAQPTARNFDPVVLNGKIYIFGGLSSSTAMTDESFEYDPATDKWQALAPMGMTRSEAASAVGPDGLIYVIGGYSSFSDGRSDRVEAYDPSTDRWVAMASLPKTKGQLTAVSVAGKLFVLGGAGMNQSDSSAVYSYLPFTSNNGAREQVMWDGRATDGSLVPDGTYTYRMTASDAAGNNGLERIGTVTVDDTAPSISGIRADSLADEPGNPLAVTAKVDGSPTRVQATLDSTTTEMTDSDGNGIYTALLLGTLAGNHDLTVSAEDVAGNVTDSAATMPSPGSIGQPLWLDSSVQDFQAGQLSDLDAATDPGYLALKAPAWQAEARSPLARSSAMAVTDVNGKIHLFGGLGSAGTTLAAHDVFDPATGLWEAKAPWPNARLDVGAALGPDGKIYLFGGARFGSSVGLAEAYDPASDSWQMLAPMGTRTTGAGVVESGGKLYVLGLAGTVGTRVQSYNPATNSWSYLGSNANRYGGYAVAAVGSKIYVIGGVDRNGVLINTVEAFDTLNNTWSTKSPLPTARSNMAVAVDEAGRIWTAGGINSNRTDKVELYDPVTDTWRAEPSLLDARQGAAGTLAGGRLWVLGGKNASTATPTDSVLSLNIAGGGSSISRVLDAGDTVNWKTVGWTATLPDETTLTISTRSSANTVNWSGWSDVTSTSGASVASPAGRYLQYRAEFASATPGDSPVLSDVVVTYQPTKPKAPVLVAPTDGSDLSSPTPNFSWKNSGSGSPGTHSYSLQVDTSPNFDSANLKTYDNIPEGTVDTSFAIPPEGRFADGVWYWQVAASDGSRQSDWSQTRHFAIDTRPDIEIKPEDVTVSGNTISEPDTATVSATIRNTGSYAGEFAVSFYDGDPETSGTLIGSQHLAGLASGATLHLSTQYDSYGKAGDHRLFVMADSEGLLAERSEGNNKASNDLFVAAHGLALGMTPSADSLSAEETMTVDMFVTNRGIATRDASLRLMVVDDQGVIVDTFYEGMLNALVPGETRGASAAWNTGRFYAGNYHLQAELTVAGHLLAVTERDFTIEPDTAVETKLSAGKLWYNANENIALTGKLRSLSRNYIFTDSKVRTQIVAENGQTVFTAEQTVSQLLPDELVRFGSSWNVGQSAPGMYKATAEFISETGEVLDTSETSFAIAPTYETGAGITGSVRVEPRSVVRWNGAAIETTVTNAGNSPVDMTIRATVFDPGSGSVLREFERAVTLSVNDSTGTVFDYPFVDLPEGKSYLVALTGEVGGAHLNLGHDSLTVTKPLDGSISRTAKARPRVLVWAKSQAQADLAKSALDKAGAFYKMIVSGRDSGDGDDDHDDDNEALLFPPSTGGDTGEGDAGHDEFVRALRSGVFNQYWLIGGSHPLEGHAGQELVEKVNAGAVLLVAGDDAMNKLTDEIEPEDSNVLGLKSEGMLPASDYAMQVLGSDVTSTGTVEFTGNAAKLELTTAQSLGTVTVGTGKKQQTYSVAAINDYGLGRAVILGFDIETDHADDAEESDRTGDAEGRAPSEAAGDSRAFAGNPQAAGPEGHGSAGLVEGILTRTAGLDLPETSHGAPYSVAPLTVDLHSLGSAIRLRATASMSGGVTPVYAIGGTITTDTISFDIDLDAVETRALEMAVRLPGESGTSTVTVALDYLDPVSGDYLPYTTLATTLTVERDLGATVDQAFAALDALAVGDKDRKTIERIKSTVADAIAGIGGDNGEPGGEDGDRSINRLLEAISKLTGVEADTTQARLDLNEVLSIAEVEWTGDTREVDHDEHEADDGDDGHSEGNHEGE